MPDPEYEVVSVRALWPPRWWRNPILWWYWRRVCRDLDDTISAPPGYHARIAAAEETAFLFGDGNKG